MHHPQNDTRRADCTPARPANLHTDQMISVATRYVARMGSDCKPSVALSTPGGDAHDRTIRRPVH
jgi:hypothetical protein